MHRIEFDALTLREKGDLIRGRAICSEPLPDFRWADVAETYRLRFEPEFLNVGQPEAKVDGPEF
jgi:hypothetical protein